MQNYINIEAHLNATNLTPIDLISINNALDAAYSEEITRKGVLDAGHKARVSFVGHLRAQNEVLANIGDVKTVQSSARNKAMAEFANLAKACKRIRVLPGKSGVSVELITATGRTVLQTGTNGDALRLGGVEVLPAREFSLYKYLPLSTPELRKTARKYVRRALDNVATN
jgi:hypothetical protein